MPDDADVDLLVIGDALTDVLVRPLGRRTAGSDTPAQVEERPGGQGANQATWLASERVRAGLVARVATGDQTRRADDLRAAGVVPFLSGDDEHASGRIVVVVDPVTGERDMFSDRGATAKLTPDDLAAGLRACRRWVHVSGYAVFGTHGEEVIATVLDTARRRELRVSVDPASSAELRRFGVDRFRRLVHGIDLLLPNLDEACLLAGVESAGATIEPLLEIAAEVAVTCGPNGAVAGRVGGPSLELPALAARVVDTTGAGDAFTAGYLAGRLDGGAQSACLTRALAAARRAVGHLGAGPFADRPGGT